MVIKLIEYMNSKKVVFGTTSSSRKKIFSDLGINFRAIGSNFEENLEKTNPLDYVNKTCLGKFEEIVKNNPDEEIDILITSDTIIIHNDKILEKPKNNQEVFDWFHGYSENDASCFTSVIIGFLTKDISGKNFTNSKRQFVTKSKITFSNIDDDLIQSYIDTGEPFNKAGGFGIQGIGCVFIKEIHGCYYNIVGFPVNSFFSQLKSMLEEAGQM